MNILLVKIYLLSNQQQIIEQAKFTYSTLGKAFEKKIKTIEDQGEKQLDALKDWKTKEQTKPIQDKSKIIFNELINKIKGLMKELYDSLDHNNLKSEYVGSNKDVSFYEHRDSKEFFNAINDNKVNFD